MRKLLLLSLLAIPCAAWAAEPADAERTVRQLEEDYWRYVQAGDVESYVKLWHDDFIGWPCHSEAPSDRSGIGGWVRDNRDVYDYGDGTQSGAGIWRKFTHTWLRTGDRWQIITGMCALQAPVVAPRS